MYIIPSRQINAFTNILSARKRCNYVESFNSRKIKCLDDIKEGIYNVYNSGVPFRPAVQKYKVGNYPQALDKIAVRVWNYFNLAPNTANTQNNFDVFHKSLCDDFLNTINPQRVNLGLADFTYGNAQKLINIFFKYLVCYSDYQLYASLFEYCHMPIDRQVLKSLRSEKVTISSELKYMGKSWTSFDYFTYINLVKEYRPMLRNNYSALYYDFCVWGNSSPTFPQNGKLSTHISQFYM